MLIRQNKTHNSPEAMWGIQWLCSRNVDVVGDRWKTCRWCQGAAGTRETHPTETGEEGGDTRWLIPLWSVTMKVSWDDATRLLLSELILTDVCSRHFVSSSRLYQKIKYFFFCWEAWRASPDRRRQTTTSHSVVKIVNSNITSLFLWCGRKCQHLPTPVVDEEFRSFTWLKLQILNCENTQLQVKVVKMFPYLCFSFISDVFGFILMLLR